MMTSRLHEIYERQPNDEIGQRAVMPYLSFDELVALNAGVLLKPLSTPQEVELDAKTMQGIPMLRKAFVKEIISAHTEGPEARAMMDRYRQICQSTELQQNADSETESTTPINNPKPADRRETEVQETFEDTIRRVIFEDPEQPKLDKLGSVITKKAHDPQAAITLARVFKENGHDFSDVNESEDELAKVIYEVYKGSGKYFISALAGMSRQRTNKTIAMWVKSFSETVSPLDVGIRLLVLKGLIAVASKGQRTAEHANELHDTIVQSMADLEGKTPIHVGTHIVKRITGYFVEGLDNLSRDELHKAVKHARQQGAQGLNRSNAVDILSFSKDLSA